MAARLARLRSKVARRASSAVMPCAASLNCVRIARNVAAGVSRSDGGSVDEDEDVGVDEDGGGGVGGGGIADIMASTSLRCGG